MKKTNLLFSLLFCFLGFNYLNAQSSSMVLYPQNQCYTALGTTANAYISPAVPGATSYSWTVFSDSCVASVTSFSSGAFVSISYPCCGIYTVGCVALNGSSPVSAFVQTITISCSSNSTLTINGSNSTCSGSSVILTGSGSTSYTWMPGGSNSASISVTPTASTCYTLYGSSCSGVAYTVKCVSVTSTIPLTVLGNTSICAGFGATLTAGGAYTYTWYTSQGTYTGSTIVLTPTASTCYSLVGASSSGCMGYSGGCITVSSGSSSLTISGNLNICSGSSTVLYASGASSYTWLPSGYNTYNLPVTPSTSTCYTLLSSGCSGTSSAVTCVTVDTTPTLSISGATTICAGSGATLTASGASSYTWYTSQGTFSGSNIVLSPSVTSCFSLTGANSTGCIGYSAGCISVQSGTNLSVSGNTNICAGGATTLTAGGAQTYTWFPSGSVGNSIVVSPTATTCYTIVGYSSGACGGLSSKMVCVNVNANTAPIITTSSPFFCAGQSNTIQASGANSYTWYPYNLTGANIAITPSVGGCYTVTGTSTTGCVGSAVGCFSVQPVQSLTITGNTNISCAGAPTTLTAYGAQSFTWYPPAFTGSSIVVSPLSSVCYSVLGTYYGCTNYAVKCLSVQPAPTIAVSGINAFCAGSTTTLFANGASSYTWLPGNLSGPIVAVTPSSNTCYTVVGTNSNGCVGLGYRCVQLTPNPTLTFVSSGVTCAGSPLSVHVAGASTYTWIPTNQHDTTIVITPSVSGCYTVSGTNAYGCTSSSVGCYYVIPALSVFVTGDSSICAGSSANLTAGGASSYTWLPGNLTGTNVVVSPSVTTCYTVLASNGGSCISKVVRCVIVQTTSQLNIIGTNLLCSGTSANLLASGANTFTWSNGSNSPFITITPTAPTCYTVTGTTSGGCIGSAVKCVSVQATPVITISGPTQLCAGANDNLIASGASSYLWNNGSTSSSIYILPSVSTIYSVTGSNGACSTTKFYTVVVNPMPILSISRTDTLSHNDSLICAGDAVHLMVNGASSYTWGNGSTSPYITVTPASTTVYTVGGTNSFGCSLSNFITLYVSACTGISKNSGSLKIGIYPNPSSGQLMLQGNGSAKINYAMYDMLGRELLKGEFFDSKDLNLSGYSNGTYIIRFESGIAITYKKVVLENK